MLDAERQFQPFSERRRVGVRAGWCCGNLNNWGNAGLAARRAGSRQRTPGVDMMGYVVRRTYTVIRGKNFVRIRRQFLRADRELDALGYVPWWRARTLCAYWGQLKYTDSIYFCQTYDAYRIFKAARRSVAWKARKEAQRGAVCQAAC